MAFNRKTWKNRISENPLRRMITNITTGVSEIIDVTRYEGIITEAGDAFSAANMNDLEARIEQGINDAGSSDIIAPTEEGPLSANAYTVGQYLIYNKINYRVIQPIAVGNSLVPGTNLVEKKVADELSNHLVVNGNAFYFDVHDGEFGYNTSESRGADTFVPFKRVAETIEFTGSYTLTVDPLKERIILFYGGFQQDVSRTWTIDGTASFSAPSTGMTGIGGSTSATRFFGGVYNFTQNYSYKVDSVSTHTWENVDTFAPGLIAIIE